MNAVLTQAAWRKFICRACGLIYDEAEGDADSGLAAGTRFDAIPDDWVCPLCGVTKADFEPCDDAPIQRRAVNAAGAPARATSGRGDAGVVIIGAGRAGWGRGRDGGFGRRGGRFGKGHETIFTCAGTVCSQLEPGLP